MFKLKTIRRLLVFVLAIAIFVSFPHSVNATTITEEKTYVLTRNKKPTDGTTTSYLYMYESAFPMGYDYDNMYAIYKPNYKTIYAYIYTMYNTESGEEIPAYCTDILTTAVKGHTYRRLNLEDSSYSSHAAGMIRTILDNGFYIHRDAGESIQTHEEKLAQKIETRMTTLRAKTGIPDLTVAEAISATQAAIWKVTHGSRLEYRTFCKLCQTLKSGDIKYYSHCYSDDLKAMDITVVAQNIETVYNYLLKLPTTPASEKVVSTASFVELHDPKFTPRAEGGYDVEVTATIDVKAKDNEDDLNLSVALNGSTVKSIKLKNGKNTYPLTFYVESADPENDKVTLTISGVQTARGYFLFDAAGNRGASQSMVGYDDSQLPVYVSVTAQESRILNIKKMTTNMKYPISDITFDIINVEKKVDEPTTQIPSDPTEIDYSLTTNVQGFASLNLTQMGLKDGTYLLVERQNSEKVVAPLAPFYVTVPSTTESESSLKDNYSIQNAEKYKITVYAKNELVGTPDVTPRGDIHLTKVDSKDSSKTLAGAQFEVYRAATPEEVQNKTATYISGLTTPVVLVPFYPTADLEGNTVSSVTSTEDGSIGIYGLEYGDYYLHEAKAPDGYNRLGAPIEITIDENSKDLAPITVNNEKGSLMPETGGMGTTLFTVAGSTLVCIACLFLYLNKRKTA